MKTAVLLTAGILAGCMRVIQITPPTTPPLSASEEIQNFVELVNEHRRRVGCAPLVWMSALADVARAHSKDMINRNYFSHNSPDGTSPFDRLRRAGIAYSKAAENIASGQRTGQQVLSSWLSSSGHRRNIEDCSLRQHGVGFETSGSAGAYGTVTNAWTHVFVTVR